MAPFRCKYFHNVNVHDTVEQSQTAEIVAAYKKAIEVLGEVANRDRCRAYNIPYIGFSGIAAYNAPHGYSPMSNHAVPYISLAGSSYKTPYANIEPREYVTPYADAPIVAGANGYHQINEVNTDEIDSAEASASGIDQVFNNTPGKAQGVIDRIDHDVAKSQEATKDNGSRSVSLGLLDGFLALANGGVLPGQEEASIEARDRRQSHLNDNLMPSAPPSPSDTIDEALSRADEDVQGLVDSVSQDLIDSQEPSQQVPPPNPYAVIYSSMDGKQLGAELRRLVDVATPKVNAILPKEQCHAAHLFYTHLANCLQARHEMRFRLTHPASLVQPSPTSFWRPPLAFQPQPTPPAPVGYMPPPAQWHNHFAPAPFGQAQLPTSSFFPRSNILALPETRNVETEHKAAGFGIPPTLSSQSKQRSGGRGGRRKQLG